MKKALWHLILTTTFGGIWRLGGTLAGTILLSILLGRLANTIPVAPGLPAAWFYGAIAIASYSLTGIIIFTFGSIHRQEHLQRITALWPLPRGIWWAVTIAPQLLICLLLFLIASPCTLILAGRLELGAGIPLVLWAGASLAGFAFTLPSTHDNGGVRISFFLGFIVTQLLLLQESLGRVAAGTPEAFLPLIGIIAIQSLALPQLTASLLRGQQPSASRTTKTRFTLPVRTLSAIWFTLKLRNPRARLSFLCCSLIMASTAFAVQFRHLALMSPTSWLLLGAIIASAFACDIRGFSRYNLAPEIEVLKGPAYFVGSEVRAAIIVGLLLGLPMLTVIMAAGVEDPAIFVVLFVGLQIFASLVGLLAGTLFARHTNDLGSQFLAAVLATGLVLWIPKLAGFSGRALIWQAGVWMLLAQLCYAFTRFIEIFRRYKYGAL